MLIKTGIQTSFKVVIFFVLTWLIINGLKIEELIKLLAFDFYAW